MKIAPENIRVGDRVTVSGTVRQIGRQPGGVDIAFDGGSGLRRLSAAEIAHAEIARPDRPLEAGDRVRTQTGVIGVIVDLHRDVAWIEPRPGKAWPCTPDDELPLSVHISRLTRIEETADDAD